MERLIRLVSTKPDVQWTICRNIAVCGPSRHNLGGGHGVLMCKYGPACDNLVSIDLGPVFNR